MLIVIFGIQYKIFISHPKSGWEMLSVVRNPEVAVRIRSSNKVF